MRAADAELLTDVAPGTPMHVNFKRYWLPVMRSDALEADGAPVRFTMLCEDYVAFRATDGRVGVFDPQCPHRQSSLVLANNRDCALTCLFHGWKFHVSGKCLETPNEPDPDFPRRVKINHYPVREAAGVLWVYFGAGRPPRFSDFVFNRVDDNQVLSRAAICHYNWLTGLEAILDPSHVGLLHRNWTDQAPKQGFSGDIQKMSKSLVAEIECERTDWGFRYAAIRDMPDGSRYVRVTEHVSPSLCFIANSLATRKLAIMSVPIDCEWSTQWYFWHSPDEPLPETDRRYAIGDTHPDHGNFYQGLRDRPNWGQDRESMKQGTNFTGFHDIMYEDLVVGEAQGAVPDRSKEHLCTADRAIVFARRNLLRQLREPDGGGEEGTSAANGFDYGALQAIVCKIGDGEDWRQAADQRMAGRAARLGTGEPVPQT